MPPKGKSRASKAVPQAAPVASDYDTDTNYTDTGAFAVVPPPPVRSNEELNMLVLRRWYPSIQSIIAIAPFAVVYIHDDDTQKWEKTESQGTLFVCQFQEQDKVHPTYRAIILNRKHPENWVFDISDSENIQFSDEYVIVQRVEAGVGEVYGIWIYSDGESDTRQMMRATFTDCATRAEAYAAQFGFSYDGEMEQEQEQELEQEQYVQEGYVQQPAALQQDAMPSFATQQHDAMPSYATPMPTQPQGHEEGQRIDINSLFAKSQPQQHSTQQPPTQQDALLNLFKR